ncbi:hypothetical protein HDV57DRAFT_482249 [Trichoderma longibrachiatum]
MSNSINPQETKHAPIGPRPRSSHFSLAQKTQKGEHAMQCISRPLSGKPKSGRHLQRPKANQAALTAARPMFMFPALFCQPKIGGPNRITWDLAKECFPPARSLQLIQSPASARNRNTRLPPAHKVNCLGTDSTTTNNMPGACLHLHCMPLPALAIQ